MRPFAYARPDRLDDAIALLGEYGPQACVLAGGTDLVVRLRMGHLRPRVVVDLKKVRALRAGIVETESALRIGALTVMTELVRDARVRERFPALVEAASVVGSVQIRNRATLAGNICNASPAADTAPALLVYGAIVNVTGGRAVPIAEFFTGPGRTVLQRGELVESIDLPFPAEGTGAAFGRVTRRRGVDLATVNLCCLVTASGVTRFACGAVGPRPFVVEGDRGTAIGLGVAAASPITDVRGGRDYRLAMLEVVGRRTLASAIGRMAHG